MARDQENSQSSPAARPPTTKRRTVLRAMLRGAIFGATIIAIGLGGVVCIQLYGSSDQLPQMSQLSRELLVDRLAIGALVVLLCAALSALLFGIAAVLSPRPHPDQSDAFADREGNSDRPYVERLRQYVHKDVSSMPCDVPSSRLRAAFSESLFAGHPALPKSAGYIRAILWRIHRLLGRGS